ncbi:MAG: hypothetical protein EOP00_18560 [Pedobacter sp.]|nr:MAG: hypothetical protein EOP00_18560 [Pedobacter sp.]
MKNILSILTLVFVFVSCTKNENPFEEAIIKYFNENAKDPKSYESLELKIIDTITAEDCAKLIIADNDINIAKNKMSILEKESEISTRKLQISEFKNDKSIVADLNKSVESKQNLLNSFIKLNSDYAAESKSMSKFLNNKESVAYLVLHKYRLKNGFGALDLFESYFTFDTNNVLINTSEKSSESFDSAIKKFKEIYLKK